MHRSLAQAVDGAQGVVFDLFHTLTDTESRWSHLPGTAVNLGLPSARWNEQLLHHSRSRLAGKERDHYQIVKSMAHAIDPTLSEARLREAVEKRSARFAYALTHIPHGNVAMIESLKAAGKRIALASNADAGEASTWPDSPLAPLFDAVAFSCDVGFVKPDVEIFQIALAGIGLGPRDCLFVGDGGSNELAAARQLGFTTVMVAAIAREMWPDDIERRLRDADFVIEKAADLFTRSG